MRCIGEMWKKPLVSIVLGEEVEVRRKKCSIRNRREGLLERLVYHQRPKGMRLLTRRKGKTIWGFSREIREEDEEYCRC